VKIGKIGESANYKVYNINTKLGFKQVLKKIKKNSGPIMIIVKIKVKKIISQRITHRPIKIRDRFMKSLEKI
jgi:hypothetical protein